ncbi:hypothetical protein SAMN02799624_06220 [Paenibacillus sp. UNC496MF]|nr:hypothetical protein SAMN02799624_06220 [Paenibacillus sp. UNC496MF]
MDAGLLGRLRARMRIPLLLLEIGGAPRACPIGRRAAPGSPSRAAKRIFARRPLCATGDVSPVSLAESACIRSGFAAG